MTRDGHVIENPLSGERILDAYDAAQTDGSVQQKLVQAGNAALPAAVLTGSFAQVTFTDNPQEPQIRAEVQQAVTAGLIKPVTNWTAILDLTTLNALLRSSGHKPIA
jgi:hypothetical protein